MDDGRDLLSRGVAETLLGARESWTRRMFEQGAALRRAGGGPVHDLSLGNPSLEPPARWTRALHDLLDDPTPGMHRYMTNAGYADVREFIAGREQVRFGLPITGPLVTMTVGAAGGLNVVLRAMMNPGDELLVPVPYFSEYEHYCTNVGAVLVPAPSTASFALDVDAIVSRIGERTRIVLLNSPNNPSGAVYVGENLDRLADALRRLERDRERPIFIIEDSPYRDLTHDGSPVASMMSRYDHTIHLTSHSKDLGLAGERIGYIVLSPRAAGHELLTRAFAFCNRVLGFVNAPALMQRALPRVLGQPDGRVDVEVYARRCRRMADGLIALGFDVLPPKAGFFLFPGLPAALRDEQGGDVVLTERLLAERTIVVPGTAFGVPGHLRLSMAADDAAIDGALAAFERACR
ncbi:pyridoxal phosphate-dependent aminotransferase [Paraliomyxa miuraensis]|uniref:pyridoxal phosphate-dependent aminotransferase n=1 Tax=Paraliomyxa miuraensis TaxID=376150 RepID=UPI0022572239|nr:pyridoxal phosphate-dependent aminotransferase [Paraliomyxa miuraensis]MCX4243794.1 pyridoxal phosphate-dependent aminotransferase [Paraliomyxa miuraensis]